MRRTACRVSSFHRIRSCNITSRSLRDVRTPPAEFRRVVRMLAVLLAQEATADLPTVEREVIDAAGTAQARVLHRRDRDRADSSRGIGDGRRGHRALARSRGVAHRALSRRGDAATQGVLQQVSRFAPSHAGLLVDPMLATGGSAVRACEIIKAAGVPRLKLLSLIAAPEGIAMFQASDAGRGHSRRCRRRTAKRGGFIYPGLGDAGDRQFGTGAETAGA